MKLNLAFLLRRILQTKLFHKVHYRLYKWIIKPFNIFQNTSVVCTIDELQYELHLEDWIQQRFFMQGEYESAELKATENLLSSDSVFLDIGANFGLYSLQLSKIITDGAIYCFEPFSLNFQRLQTNISRNNRNNIHAQNMAVGDSNQEITLYYNESDNNLGMVSAKRMKGATLQENIKMTSIDSFVEVKKLTRIDLIKIDVEGFEYNVLQGMLDTLKRFKPTILMEVLADGTKTDLSYELLKELGYEKLYINNDGTTGKTLAKTNKKRKNYLFKIPA